MKDFLLSENGGPKGQAAFNNLKAFVLRDLFDRSINASTTTGGEPTFNPAKLGTFKADLEAKGLFDQLFDAQERQLITDVIRIGKLRKVDQKVYSSEGPSSFAIRTLKNMPVFAALNRLSGGLLEGVGQAYQTRRRENRILNPISGLEPAVQRAASRQQEQLFNTLAIPRIERISDLYLPRVFKLVIA